MCVLRRFARAKFRKWLVREGIRLASKAGWIMSMNNLWRYIYQNEHYFTIQTTKQLRCKLDRFVVGVLRTYFKSTDGAPVSFD